MSSNSCLMSLDVASPVCLAPAISMWLSEDDAAPQDSEVRSLKLTSVKLGSPVTWGTVFSLLQSVKK